MATDTTEQKRLDTIKVIKNELKKAIAKKGLCHFDCKYYINKSKGINDERITKQPEQTSITRLN